MKHTKRFISILCVISLAAALAGCGYSKLSDGFKEDEVIAQAQEVITQLSEGNYQAVTDMTRADLQDDLSASALETALGNILTSAGTFRSFGKSTVVGQQDQKTGEDYAVTVTVVQYENSKLTYTISFDEKLQIVGLYLK